MHTETARKPGADNEYGETSPKERTEGAKKRRKRPEDPDGHARAPSNDRTVRVRKTEGPS